jgi:hypothetical protein
LADECPLKKGLIHGIQHRSDTPGKLRSAEPHSNGLPHGTARQWSNDGKLMGSYTMKHGTGIDLWWCDECGIPYLSEAGYLKDGKWHGFEWWLNHDQKSVGEKSHFRNNQMHGIERSWNHMGRLQRGYPRYWANDVRLTKRQYLRAMRQGSNSSAFPRNRQPSTTESPASDHRDSGAIVARAHGLR